MRAGGFWPGAEDVVQKVVVRLVVLLLGQKEGLDKGRGGGRAPAPHETLNEDEHGPVFGGLHVHAANVHHGAAQVQGFDTRPDLLKPNGSFTVLALWGCGR